MSKKRKLFTVTAADCEMQTFRTGGKGGQNQNKRNMGVRFIHPPSGAVGESREHRSQYANKKAAWQRMGESKKFRAWVKVEAARRQGEKSVDEIVDEAMAPGNIKVEVKDEQGRWKVVKKIMHES